MSNSTYACGKAVEKTSSEKKISSKKESTDSYQEGCCESEHNSKKDQHGCNGKCDHSSCTTSILQFSLITANEFDFNNNIFNFSPEKSISYYKTARLCDGFASIWLIPKIK